MMKPSIDDLRTAMKQRGYSKLFQSSDMERWGLTSATITITDNEIIYKVNSILRSFYRAAGGLELAIQFVNRN